MWKMHQRSGPRRKKHDNNATTLQVRVYDVWRRKEVVGR